MRGHNLYDIFYGRYKKQEAQILTQYIELAQGRILQISWIPLNVLFILKAGKTERNIFGEATQSCGDLLHGDYL